MYFVAKQRKRYIFKYVPIKNKQKSVVTLVTVLKDYVLTKTASDLGVGGPTKDHLGFGILFYDSFIEFYLKEYDSTVQNLQLFDEKDEKKLKNKTEIVGFSKHNTR